MKRTRRAEERLEKILDDYTRVLNTEGLESKAEVAFLDKYRDDPEVMNMVRATRALRAIFAQIDQFPLQIDQEASRRVKEDEMQAK